MARELLDSTLREDPVDEAIAAYLAAAEVGRPPDPQEWLARHPDLADELASFLADRALFQSFAESLPCLPATKNKGPVRILCPHCNNPIEPAEAAPRQEVLCPCCGSSFRLEEEATGDWPLPCRGQKVGRFELLDTVGVGAFGTVYKARDPQLDRTVAIKVPRTGGLVSQADLDRFLREARSVAQLRHPGIVPVHEVGHHEGMPYLVSDFVAGVTLADFLSARRPAPGQAAEWTAVIAEALQYAHEHGVVHRDIKPSNILLGEDGMPHLMDFGLAKRDAGEVTMTLDGTVLGTPAYMSPEQARGESHKVDGRSDLYSLGVILYQLLTGELPFRGTTRMLLDQVLHDEPRPPHRLNDKIPRDLETICLKAMAKEPRRRYQTAQELADDLRRWLRGEPIKARPVGVPERAWRWCRRNAAVAISAAAVLLLLATVAAVSSVAAVWLRQQRDTALASWNRAEQAEKDAEERLWQSLLDRARAGRWSGRMGRRFDSLQALHEAARLRPSLQLRSEAIACMTLVDMRVAREWKGLPPGGTALAFDVPIERYARSDDKGNISVRRVADDEEILRLPGPGLRAHFLQFSPNSQLLAAVYHHWSPPQLWVWDLDRRKTLLELAPGVHRQGFDFSPDSRLVAFGHKDGTICLYDLTSGKQVKRLVAGLAASSPGAIRFHPDGRRLAVASSQLPGVQVHELDTAKVTALPHPAGVIAVAWRADGKLLATAGRDYNIYLWDMADLDQPRAVLKGHQAEVVRVAFNQAGDLLASQGWDGTTRLWDSSTGRQLVSTDTKGAGPIHFSADDRLLAFGKVGVKVRLWEVARRQECRTCRGHVVQAQQGPWVVDISSGGRLMASSDLDGIRLWDLAAGGEVALLPPCAGGAVFHPAGESLFTYDPQGLLRWPIQAEPASAVGLQIGPPQKLAGAEVLGPPIRTPQGRTLVLVAGPDRAAVLDADTQRQTILEQSPPKLLHTAISPDGRWVAAGNWHESGVKVWNAASGKFVRELPAPGSARAFFSPDARWLITATGAEYRFWEVGCWQPGLVVSREGAGDLPGLAAFSGDGKHLAVAHSRKVIHLLDPTTGDRVAALEAPEPQQLLHLCFSPDGSRLAAACGTHVIQVWDLRLIRRQLQVMGLAWDLPDYPAAPERDAQNPLQVKVLLGDLASPASQPALPREERTRLAIEHYRRAAEAQPNDAEACKKLAFLYATAPVPLRDPQKALPLARKAVQLAPDNASCRHVLGVACYTAGRYREAVQTLQANLKCQEDRFLAFDLFVLALSHQKLGETARAQEYHELARRWSRMPNSLTPLYAEILNSYRAEAEAVLDERAR